MDKGKIIIKWEIAGHPEGDLDEDSVAWQLSLDPPGLSDEQVAAILRMVADRV